MTNRVIKGKAFWEFDGSGQKHLYFVLSEPDIDDKVLIVNITDANNSPAKYDKSCEISRQEHPAVIKPSVVFYYRAKEVNASSILYELSKGGLEAAADLTENLLIRVQEGAKVSDFLPGKFKKYFEFF